MLLVLELAVVLAESCLGVDGYGGALLEGGTFEVASGGGLRGFLVTILPIVCYGRVRVAVWSRRSKNN